MFIRKRKLDDAANNIDSVLTFLEEFDVSTLRVMMHDEDDFEDHVQLTIDAMKHDLTIALRVCDRDEQLISAEDF